MKIATTLLLVGALGMGVAVAQDSAKQDMKDAGHATKTAAKDTGHATATGAKDVGHATATGAKDVGHGTKKVVNKGASKTEEGAGKVKDKTTPQ